MGHGDGIDWFDIQRHGWRTNGERAGVWIGGWVGGGGSVMIGGER